MFTKTRHTTTTAPLPTIIIPMRRPSKQPSLCSKRKHDLDVMDGLTQAKKTSKNSQTSYPLQYMNIWPRVSEPAPFPDMTDQWLFQRFGSRTAGGNRSCLSQEVRPFQPMLHPWIRPTSTEDRCYLAEMPYEILLHIISFLSWVPITEMYYEDNHKMVKTQTLHGAPKVLPIGSSPSRDKIIHPLKSSGLRSCIPYPEHDVLDHTSRMTMVYNHNQMEQVPVKNFLCYHLNSKCKYYTPWNVHANQHPKCCESKEGIIEAGFEKVEDVDAKITNYMFNMSQNLSSDGFLPSLYELKRYEHGHYHSWIESCRRSVVYSLCSFYTACLLNKTLSPAVSTTETLSEIFFLNGYDKEGDLDTALFNLPWGVNRTILLNFDRHFQNQLSYLHRPLAYSLFLPAKELLGSIVLRAFNERRMCIFGCTPDLDHRLPGKQYLGTQFPMCNACYHQCGGAFVNLYKVLDYNGWNPVMIRRFFYFLPVRWDGDRHAFHGSSYMKHYPARWKWSQSQFHHAIQELEVEYPLMFKPDPSYLINNSETLGTHKIELRDAVSRDFRTGEISIFVEQSKQKLWLAKEEYPIVDEDAPGESEREYHKYIIPPFQTIVALPALWIPNPKTSPKTYKMYQRFLASSPPNSNDYSSLRKMEELYPLWVMAQPHYPQELLPENSTELSYHHARARNPIHRPIPISTLRPLLGNLHDLAIEGMEEEEPLDSEKLETNFIVFPSHFYKDT